MQRDLRLDTTRGLLLILMTINHFGSWLSKDWWGLHFTWQPLGYVSAAEGFVFLAGFVFSLVYGRYAANPAVLWSQARQRAFAIYTYHLVMVLSLAVVFLSIPFYRTGWAEWFSPYHVSPFSSTVAAVLLFYQPPYLDILPMYTLFVLGSPLALDLLHRRNLPALLVVSFLLWFLGQFLHPWATAILLFFPGHHPGYFNLLSWQFLYVLGLVLGGKYYQNEPIRLLRCKPLMGLIFLCTFLLFLTRHSLILPELTDGIDRASLGWLRLVNFLLLLATLGAIFPKIPLHCHVPWLTSLGQHALPVFSFHLVLLYFFAPLTNHIAERSGAFGVLPFLVAILSCLYLPVLAHERYKARTRSLKVFAPWQSLSRVNFFRSPGVPSSKR